MKRRDFLNTSLFAAAGLGAARPLFALSPGAAVADIPAITGDGREIVLKGVDVRDLAARLRGKLLVAGEPGYDQSRLVQNPSFDRHPALVAQPTGVADLQAVVNFARANALLVAVKCGGHSASGQSTCDRGLLIDLANLRGVRVDPKARRAWVEGGTLLGQVDHECLAHGLVTPLGTVSHTGVGGLTLGGGFGRLARKYGLAVDHVESVDIVTADGKLRHASATENPDLYWAVRGGGGNFGIVTNFEFRLHPMPDREVVSGSLAWPLARARDVLDVYADYVSTAPDEMYLDPMLLIPGGGRDGFVSVDFCWSGAKGDVERALAPIRKIGKPMRENVAPIDYQKLQRSMDEGEARVIASYLKGGFVSTFSPALPEAIVGGLAGDPGRTTVLFFQHCGGAASRVAENATAFAQRDSLANMMAVSAWRVGGDPAAHIEATRKYWKTLEPFTSGFYVNDLAREVTAGEINANYRGNYARLVAVKKTYDSANLFRLNANVRPA
jgi:FAD/FMN-containing dehydrogenase